MLIRETDEDQTLISSLYRRGKALFYLEPMRCMFHIDGDQRGTWHEERDDLPLYPGDTVSLDGADYEIIDGPRFEVDWASSAVTASFIAKPAPTNY
jgi:hypothetical protein